MRHLKKKNNLVNLAALLILLLMLAACKDGSAGAGGQKDQALAATVNTEESVQKSTEPAAATKTDQADAAVEESADRGKAAVEPETASGTDAAVEGSADRNPAAVEPGPGTGADASADKAAGGNDETAAAAGGAADTDNNNNSVNKVSARKLEIKSQPEETIVEAGEPAVFQVFAEGDGLIYQWQTREPDREDWRDTQDGEGYNTSRLEIPDISAKENNISYRCRITDRSGETVYTDGAKLYVFAIQASPKDQYVKAEDSASFTVSATGKDLHYSWEYCRASEDEWKKSTAKGHDTAVLQVPNIPVGHNGFRYRCAVTDAAGNKAYSEDARLYVMGFLSDPSNQYVKRGGSAVFKVKASGKDLKYRWYVKLPGEEEWKKVSEEGADTSVLKLYDLPTAKDNRRFRCLVTDPQGNKMYSKAAALYVLGITANPTSEYVRMGDTLYFVVEATGKGLKYQWQVLPPDEDEWKKAGEDGAKTPVLMITDVKPTKNKRRYRCMVTDEKGNKVYSKAAGVYVLSISSNPSSQNVKDKGTASFKVSATGSGLKYQWQTRKSSSHGWYNWSGSGNKSRKISVHATTSDNGYQFRCAVTDKAGHTAYSNAATLYVFGITGNPKNQSVKAGKKAEFHVTATGRDLKYQWQVKTSSGGSWKSASNNGNKSKNLKFEAKTAYNGYYYRCKVTDKLGRVMYSKSAKLTVKKGSGGGGSGDQYNVITPNF